MARFGYLDVDVEGSEAKVAVLQSTVLVPMNRL